VGSDSPLFWCVYMAVAEEPAVAVSSTMPGPDSPSSTDVAPSPMPSLAPSATTAPTKRTYGSTSVHGSTAHKAVDSLNAMLRALQRGADTSADGQLQSPAPTSAEHTPGDSGASAAVPTPVDAVAPEKRLGKVPPMQDLDLDLSDDEDAVMPAVSKGNANTDTTSNKGADDDAAALAALNARSESEIKAHRAAAMQRLLQRARARQALEEDGEGVEGATSMGDGGSKKRSRGMAEKFFGNGDEGAEDVDMFDLNALRNKSKADRAKLRKKPRVMASSSVLGTVDLRMGLDAEEEEEEDGDETDPLVAALVPSASNEKAAAATASADAPSGVTSTDGAEDSANHDSAPARSKRSKSRFRWVQHTWPSLKAVHVHVGWVFGFLLWWWLVLDAFVCFGGWSW